MEVAVTKQWLCLITCCVVVCTISWDVSWYWISLESLTPTLMLVFCYLSEACDELRTCLFFFFFTLLLDDVIVIVFCPRHSQKERNLEGGASPPESLKNWGGQTLHLSKTKRTDQNRNTDTSTCITTHTWPRRGKKLPWRVIIWRLNHSEWLSVSLYD